MAMGMGMASSSSTTVPLDAAWGDMQPSRQAPYPPSATTTTTTTGTNGMSTTSSRRNSAAQGLSSSSRSAGNSPNLNRTSGGFGGGGVGGGNGMISPGSGGGLNGAVPPARPSRAGTLPLDGMYTALNGFAISGQPSSSLAANGMNTAPVLPPINTMPTYNRAPATISAAGGGGGGGGLPQLISPTSALPSHPPLTHQSFSAPTNPYSLMGETSDEPETMVIEEKDLPEKPKGRERSGTNKSRDGGKKGVFGFMTGELERRAFHFGMWGLVC